MNILSKILLSGHDIKLESASWSGMVEDLPGGFVDAAFYKLSITKHGSELIEVMGAVSHKTLLGDSGDEVVLNSLEEMFKLVEGK